MKKAAFKFDLALRRCIAERPTKDSELAKYCGITHRTVAAWRQPKGAQASLDKALMICGFFGKSFPEFAAMGES